MKKDERTTSSESRKHFTETFHRTLDPFSVDIALLLYFSSFRGSGRWFLPATTNFPTNERQRKGGGAMSTACYPGLRHGTRFCETCARFVRRISWDFRFTIIFAFAYRRVSQKTLFTLQFKPVPHIFVTFIVESLFYLWIFQRFIGPWYSSYP